MSYGVKKNPTILQTMIKTGNVEQTITCALDGLLANQAIDRSMVFWLSDQQLYVKSRTECSHVMEQALHRQLALIALRHKPSDSKKNFIIISPDEDKKGHTLVLKKLFVGPELFGICGVVVSNSNKKNVLACKTIINEMSDELALVLALGGEIYQLKQAHYEAISGMTAVIQTLDEYTRNHSCNVANYALLLAGAMGLSADMVRIIYYGGLFHDVGKIGISPDILRKSKNLTPEEYELIKEHPAKGAHIISQFSAFSELVPIILHHHEQFDGSGYPDGLLGNDIPLGARIIAVTDAYDALTTNRTYRKAQDMKFAFDEIAKNSKTQFDPVVVKAFLRVAKKL